ncbi:lipid-A-disaccharide synthase [Pseudopedobacter beijingensis]|uniref:Lipid-A-disaccharide synthase n=1 Tax=Pseudopedobacter beijingensis TaxID=1207056 RepID=A0ABW4I6K1_9SPHI
MKYYIIAGEASGDLHGANLMKALKEVDDSAEFRFFGGDLMQAQGGDLIKHYKDMAFMGFVEVVLNLRTVLKNISFCQKDVLQHKPDVLILIDFPGFNLKIADFAKKNNIKVFYYISPKVWAWNQKRVLKIKKVVDKMFCIFPFEVDFYKKWGMEVDYVGNPLLDAIAAFEPHPEFKEENKLSEKEIIALLPGSRRQELRYLLPSMVSLVSHFPEYQFVIAGAPNFTVSDYQEYTGGHTLPVVFSQTYDLLSHAKAAVVTSGTATLETALFWVPEVVVYRGNPISIGIAKLLVKIGFISLVNLVVDREIVKELIQEDCNENKLKQEVEKILSVNGRGQMMEDYNELHNRMGEPGASKRAATLMYNYLKK